MYPYSPKICSPHDLLGHSCNPITSGLVFRISSRIRTGAFFSRTELGATKDGSANEMFHETKIRVVLERLLESSMNGVAVGGCERGARGERVFDFDVGAFFRGSGGVVVA